MKMVESLEDHALLKTVLFIQDNGLMVLEMDTDHRCGLMAQDMKDVGRMIRLMDKVNWYMLMVTSMRVNG